MTTRACNLNNDLFCFLFIYTLELTCFFLCVWKGKNRKWSRFPLCKVGKEKREATAPSFFPFFPFFVEFFSRMKKKMEETMDDDRRENVIVSSVSLVVRREGEEYSKSKGGAPLPQSFPASLLFLRLCFFLYLFLSLSPFSFSLSPFSFSLFLCSLPFSQRRTM